MILSFLILAGYGIYAILSLFFLWVYYLAVMNLARVKQTQGLNKPSTILGIFVLVIGYILDTNANIGVMTVLGLEMPSELLVTQRLKRWITEPDGTWHKRLALWFEVILDPFDPSGDHV